MIKQKISTSLILLGLFASCQSNENFRRVEEIEIDESRLKIATDITNVIVGTLNDGKYYRLSKDEAETKMIDAFSESVQRNAFEEVTGAYGQYENVAFHELLKPTDGTLYEIYRFKMTFQSSDSVIEVRTVLNAQGKLAGFFMIPWKEKM